MSDLAKCIHALLFFKGESLERTELAKLCSCNEADVAGALAELAEALEDSGLALVRTDTAATLTTAPDQSELITALRKRELTRELGKAGLETLTIVLYGAPITRGEIDYIRGVNSAFVVRNLLVRGLIERTSDAQDRRLYRYQPTTDVLRHLGVAGREELPEFAEAHRELTGALSESETADGEKENA